MGKIAVIFSICLAFIAVADNANPVEAQASCSAQQAIFPVASAPPPFYWALVNGDQGVITRAPNNSANCPQNWNINTVNFSLDAAAGVYMEVGMFETGTPGFNTHSEVVFRETMRPGGAVTFTSFDGAGGRPAPPCGPLTNDGGLNPFRIYRYWGNTWAGDIACGVFQPWINIQLETFSSTYSYGLARTEFERFPASNTISNRISYLQYRDITTGVWSPWTGMGCPSAQTLPASLSRQGPDAWILLNGAQTC